MIAPRLLLASLAMVFGLWPVALALLLLVIAEHYLAMNLLEMALGLKFKTRAELDDEERGSDASKADRAFEAWGDRVFGHPDKGRKSAVTVYGKPKEENGQLIAVIKCPACGKRTKVNGAGGSHCSHCQEDLG